jgi:predicted aldo/keto reductase-like oxidoreductase
MEDVETIVGPNGALEAFVAARDQGLIRFLGFSAHSQEAALSLMDHFDFDTILFPVNYVCWHQGQFGPSVLDKARQNRMGILALKALAKKPWADDEQRRWAKTWYSPVDTYEEARAALAWTLARPVTACVCPSHAEFLWWMIQAEKELAQLTPNEEETIARSTENIPPIFPTQ